MTVHLVFLPSGDGLPGQARFFYHTPYRLRCPEKFAEFAIFLRDTMETEGQVR
jgi:hypothetical protein